MSVVVLVFGFVRCRYAADKVDAKLSKCDPVVVSVMATQINLALGIFS